MRKSGNKRGTALAVVAIVLCAGLIAGCTNTPNTPIQAPQPTAPQVLATRVLPTPPPEDEGQPSAEATLGSDVTPPPAPATEAVPTVTRVTVFLVAVGDNGQAGKKIGCDDSLVAVEREVEPATEPVTAALQSLFAIHEQNYGQSGLYNALYQSQLTVDVVTVADGKATVQLSGQTMLNGVCDNPRVEAQIEETILQAAGVSEVAVTINDKPLEEVLSLK